jgi:hypothetical protein
VFSSCAINLVRLLPEANQVGELTTRIATTSCCPSDHKTNHPDKEDNRNQTNQDDKSFHRQGYSDAIPNNGILANHSSF